MNERKFLLSSFEVNTSLIIKQRCPTHLPLVTCGENPLNCEEWLCVTIFQIYYALGKVSIVKLKYLNRWRGCNFYELDSKDDLVDMFLQMLRTTKLCWTSL